MIGMACSFLNQSNYYTTSRHEPKIHNPQSILSFDHWGSGTPPKLAANLGFLGFLAAPPPLAGVDSLLRDPLPLLPTEEEEELLLVTKSLFSTTPLFSVICGAASLLSLPCSSSAFCFTTGFTDFLTTFRLSWFWIVIISFSKQPATEPQRSVAWLAALLHHHHQRQEAAADLWT